MKRWLQAIVLGALVAAVLGGWFDKSLDGALISVAGAGVGLIAVAFVAFCTTGVISRAVSLTAAGAVALGVVLSAVLGWGDVAIGLVGLVVGFFGAAIADDANGFDGSN